jgi:hypothetical protein
MENEITELSLEIQVELMTACEKFPSLHSAHEAYGVLAEELAEFFDEVRKSPRHRNNDAMRRELIQIAAMAMRTIIDLGL